MSLKLLNPALKNQTNSWKNHYLNMEDYERSERTDQRKRATVQLVETNHERQIQRHDLSAERIRQQDQLEAGSCKAPK